MFIARCVRRGSIIAAWLIAFTVCCVGCSLVPRAEPDTPRQTEEQREQLERVRAENEAVREALGISAAEVVSLRLCVQNFGETRCLENMECLFSSLVSDLETCEAEAAQLQAIEDREAERRAEIIASQTESCLRIFGRSQCTDAAIQCLLETSSDNTCGLEYPGGELPNLPGRPVDPIDELVDETERLADKVDELGEQLAELEDGD